MKRTVSATESYDHDLGWFTLTAKCPFCKKVNRYDDSEKKTCGHFESVQHGCGGTIFVFKREDKDHEVSYNKKVRS